MNSQVIRGYWLNFLTLQRCWIANKTAYYYIAPYEDFSYWQFRSFG